MFHKTIGKNYQEKGDPPDPDPLVKKYAAVLGQQQSHNNSQPENSNRILFLQAETRGHTEPQPIAWVLAFDREYGEIHATHPEVRFKAVSGEQASVREILWRNDRTDCAEQHGITSAAEFTREDGRLYDQ